MTKISIHKERETHILVLPPLIIRVSDVSKLSLEDIDLKLLSNIRSHIEALEPQIPNRVVVTVGQYTLDLLTDFQHLREGIIDLIRVYHKKDLEHKTIILDSRYTLEIDTLYEPHYWFDLQKQIDEEKFKEEIEKRFYRYHENILSITNLGEGAASGILPVIHRFLNDMQKNSLGVAVFPSMSHSSDALFNAFACIGRIFLENTTPIILIDQSNLEEFSGIHRDGEPINGIEIIDYMIEILLEKEGFLKDFCTLSNNFKILNFIPLLATGCSLDVYENLRNILDITLEQPLMNIDLSTSSMIFVLVRAPVFYRDEYSKGNIEYEVSKWLSESIKIDIPQVCETIFTEEFSDRIDVLILMGGFYTQKLFRDVYRRIERFSNMNLEQNLINVDLWNRIKKKLLETNKGIAAIHS
jgi:hypothetical protein